MPQTENYLTRKRNGVWEVYIEHCIDRDENGVEIAVCRCDSQDENSDEAWANRIANVLSQQAIKC